MVMDRIFFLSRTARDGISQVSRTRALMYMGGVVVFLLTYAQI